MTLALLNLGPEEILLILVLFLVLFGADKVPEVARQLGRARAQLERTRGQLTDAMRSDDEKQLDEQLKFERAREQHMEQQNQEWAALRRAAEELGIDATGMDDAVVRQAIRERVAGGEESGSAETARQ